MTTARVPNPFPPLDLVRRKEELSSAYLQEAGRSVRGLSVLPRQYKLRRLQEKIQDLNAQLDAQAVVLEGAVGHTVKAASWSLMSLPLAIRTDMLGAWDTLLRAAEELKHNPHNAESAAVVDSRFTIIVKVCEAHESMQAALKAADEQAALPAPQASMAYTDEDLVTANNLMQAIETGSARATDAS